MSILFGSFWASGFITSDLKNLDVLGVVMGICSAVSYTASMIVSGTVATDVPPLLRSCLSVTGQMLFVYIIFPPTFLFTGALGQGLWLWIGLLEMIGIVTTTFAYNKGIPYIGAGLAGILGSAEIPTVLLFSTIILKEDVSVTQWMGVGFILFGILLISITSTGWTNSSSSEFAKPK